jgi:NhaA family Na+:H+ antiporter
MTEELSRLSKPVDIKQDHYQGLADSPIVLVEYGDYSCPYCRQVMPVVRELQDHLGDRLQYVFRHFPISSVYPNSQLAAEAAEAAGAQGKFWEMHDILYELTNPNLITLENLCSYASELGLDEDRFRTELEEGVYAEKVREDYMSGVHSDVNGTPTFFINGERYDGAWDFISLMEAIEKPLGVRVNRAFQEFVNIQASGGILLLLGTIIALVWANSPWAESYFHLWETEVAFEFGAFHLGKHLLHWINDGLMVIFFFVVGLEIKREVLAGELRSPRKALLPIMAAIGGMLFPALLFFVFNNGEESVSGWGIPMATDIAFTLGLMAVLGKRVPIALKVFFTALAIADDLGAVLVIALFYSSGIQWAALGAGALILLALIGLNRARVYAPLPYAILGVGLWLAFLQSGVHPTIAGVLLAMTIPSLTTANTTAFLAQATTVLENFERMSMDGTRDHEIGSPRQAVARTLTTIAQRVESPLQRLERTLHPWTTYAVVPIFALANAGVALEDSIIDALTSPISMGIVVGLVLGKSIGITLLTWLTIRLKLADLPAGTSMGQIFAASWLAGIGFTMSLFIASAEFSGLLLDQAKVGIIAGSLLAAVIGTVLLFVFEQEYDERTETELIQIMDRPPVLP